MPRFTIKRVDTFSTKPFTGNPAGVVCNADCLSKEQMQETAREMRLNLVEFAFVSSPNNKRADFRVHFFTPEKELEISGHAVIGACFSLIEEGLIELNEGLTTIRLETGIGIIPVEIFATGQNGAESLRCKDNPDQTSRMSVQVRNSRNKRIFQLHRIMLNEPVHRLERSTIPPGEIAEVLGIDEEEITNTGLPVALASYEFDWLLIPVLHRETLYSMNPDLIKLKLMNRKYGIKTNHLFTLDAFSQECIAYSRHFGPLIGLWEDPATAIASAMLSVYLVKHGITSSASMQIEQGNETDGLSRIFVDIDYIDGEVKKLRVGGLAVTSLKKEIFI